jgi:hypothetical protein
MIWRHGTDISGLFNKSVPWLPRKVENLFTLEAKSEGMGGIFSQKSHNGE